MLKKTLALLMAVVLLLCASACGKEEQPAADNDAPETEIAEQESSADEETEEEVPEEKKEETDAAQQAKPKPSETEEVKPQESKIYLVNFIGKTVGEIKNHYGAGYTFDGFSGSSTMEYEDKKIAFILDGFYENPTDDKKIVTVVSYGAMELLKGLNGEMKYPEIVSAVGSKVQLEEPEHWYSEMDGVWEYSLSFELEGYDFHYSWDQDPNEKPCMNVFVSIASEQEAASDPAPAPEPEPPAAEEMFVGEDDALVKLIKHHLDDTYFSDRGMTVLEVSIYNSDDEILTIDFKTDNAYAQIGVDYYKKTRVIELYDTGVLKYTDTLPK